MLIKYLIIKPSYSIIRILRKVHIRLKLISLKLRGVNVDWSAKIHPAAIIEPNGGNISIGKNSFIDRNVILRGFGGSIIIGDDCSVNAFSLLSGGGGIEIGDSVRIASHSVIVASNHKFIDKNILIKDQGMSQIGINIENDVWVGAGSKILDGVQIRQGTVIGAGSVVTKSTEAYSVIAGVPAKFIKKRKHI